MTTGNRRRRSGEQRTALAAEQHYAAEERSVGISRRRFRPMTAYCRNGAAAAADKRPHIISTYAADYNTLHLRYWRTT